MLSSLRDTSTAQQLLGLSSKVMRRSYSSVLLSLLQFRKVALRKNAANLARNVRLGSSTM